MRRRDLLSRMINLSREKQVIAVCSVGTLIACFLPWYGINSVVINAWQNAFESIGSIAGYILVAFSLLSLVMIAIPVLSPDYEIEDRLQVKESALLLFFSAQSFFVTLIFVPVFAQYSLLSASNSSTRFGIYVALIATLVSSLFALSMHRKGAQSSLLKERGFMNVPRMHRTIATMEHEAMQEEETLMPQTPAEQQEAMFEPREQVASSPSEPTITDVENEEPRLL